MKRLLLVILAVFLLWTFWTSLTQVETGELAVVRRFGRILPDKPKPGLHIGLPWGIDRVQRINVAKTRQVTAGFSGAATERDVEDGTPAGQLLTGDHNLINLQVQVQYSVASDEVENFMLLEDKADTIVERATEAAMAEWVGGRSVDEVLLRGKAVLPATLQTRIQEHLDPYELGVHVESVSVTELLLPTQVKTYFDDVARAQTQIRTLRNGAEQAADSMLRETAGKIYDIRQSTSAYASEQVQLAAAEAGSFEKHVKQYHELREQNPYYLAGLWWNDMGRLYQRMHEKGCIDLLDNQLSSNGLNITQMPLLPKK